MFPVTENVIEKRHIICCPYCKQVLGQPHLDACPFIKKKVSITIEFIVDIPNGLSLSKLTRDYENNMWMLYNELRDIVDQDKDIILKDVKIHDETKFIDESNESYGYVL